MSTKLARNAWAIVDAIKNGYTVDEMIIVSLVGDVDASNHTVYCNCCDDYDWKWCKNLKIIIYAREGLNFGKVLNDIAAHNPAFLAVWDVDGMEGATVKKKRLVIDSGENLRVFGDCLDIEEWHVWQNREFCGLKFTDKFGYEELKRKSKE